MLNNLKPIPPKVAKVAKVSCPLHAGGITLTTTTTTTLLISYFLPRPLHQCACGLCVPLLPLFLINPLIVQICLGEIDVTQDGV